MVLHYASLAANAGGVDAILIGSELKSLTRVRSASGVYPAVDALATLAVDVKAIVGASTVVTYGADWTEYGSHVVDAAANEVRFPLDTLWASPSINVIGIDYYAPLSDWRGAGNQLDRALTDNPYRLAYLTGNLAGGEGYEWFYGMPRREAQSPTDSANPGCSARKIYGISGRSRTESVSVAQNSPTQRRGYQGRNRSGSPR
jgi:hypothetical protein